jgi:hypothetical protein
MKEAGELEEVWRCQYDILEAAQLSLEPDEGNSAASRSLNHSHTSLPSRPQKLICDYAEDFLRAES